MRDVLSPFKAQETDSKATAVAKKLANYGLRAGVGVAVGAAAATVVPMFGLIAGGVTGMIAGAGLSGKLLKPSPEG